jgi:hypothetical protein
MMELFGSLFRPAFTHLLPTRGREPGVEQTRHGVER